MSEGVSNVIHVVISLAYGGLERLVVDWSNGRNVRCAGSTSVCCLDAEGELAGNVDDGAVFCVGADRRKVPWDIGAVSKLREAVRGLRGDGNKGPVVLHAHNLAAWQYAVLAAMGTDTRVVYTQHGANIHDWRIRNRIRARILKWFTAETVAVSESTAVAMSRIFGLRKDGIAVVLNGISVCMGSHDPDGISEKKEAVGIGEDSVVIGSVGRLAHVKGYDRLIGSYAEILKRQEHTSLVLLLVGDGPERQELERLVTAMGIADHVVFAGFRPDGADWIRVMDLFVLPSRNEGAPVALLEAMAAGVPVAVTDVGDCRAILDDGLAGELLAEDEDEWSALLVRMIEAVRGRSLDDRVARAKERVSARYSLSRTIDAYEGVYARACQ